MPAGSNAQVGGYRSVTASLVPDVSGTYTVQLVVNDGHFDSVASVITVTTANTPPVANAGPAQVVGANSLVQLTGAQSTDVDGDSLTYTWSLITTPSGSTAALSNTHVVNPTFTADLVGWLQNPVGTFSLKDKAPIARSSAMSNSAYRMPRSSRTYSFGFRTHNPSD